MFRPLLADCSDVRTNINHNSGEEFVRETLLLCGERGGKQIGNQIQTCCEEVEEPDDQHSKESESQAESLAGVLADQHHTLLPLPNGLTVTTLTENLVIETGEQQPQKCCDEEHHPKASS